MVERVQDIIKNGLKKGKYYKVYVTQVNTAGVESPKSDAVMIRVGDTLAPPIPLLSLNSLRKNKGSVDVMLTWTPSICDDLSHYILYTWRSWADWDNDGVRLKDKAASASTNIIIQNTVTSYTLQGQRNQEYVWIGMQAVDISNNHSDIYVIRVLAEDTSVLDRPADAPTVTPGVWLIQVDIDCPQSTQIEKIAIYRDNQATTFDGISCVGLILFYPGMVVSYIDNLRVLDGLTHYYTYAWIDYNGNVSPRSPASATVTAKAIDTTEIDLVAFEALNNAWSSDFISNGGVVDIEKLKTDLATQSAKIVSLANQLLTVQDNYDAIYNKYNLLVNTLSIISAKIDQQGNIQSAMQTAIQQNATDINLRATKIALDMTTNQITDAYTSLFNMNAQSIALVVSNLNNDKLAYATIAENYDAIQLKVNQNGIISAINLSPEDIDISGSRLHISADTLFDGNVNINGILNANAIYQAGFKLREAVINKGTIGPGGTIPLPNGYTEDQCSWSFLGKVWDVDEAQCSLRWRTLYSNGTPAYYSITGVK